jgi:hypothetical protein
MYNQFSKSSGFNGFPSLGFQARSRSQINLYSKDKAIAWLDASENLPQGTVNNSLIPFWSDKLFGTRYAQTNVALQPRWLEADPLFNNLPVINFDVGNKGMVSDNLQGPPFAGNFTVALVYQALTMSNTGGSPYPVGSIFYDINFGISTRNGFHGYCWRTNTRLQAGYHFGTDPVPPKTASAMAITTPVIVVISRDGFVGNGSVLTPDFNNIINAGTINTLGSNNLFGTGAIMKIAEIIVYNENYDNSACLDICNNINSKYAIY